MKKTIIILIFIIVIFNLFSEHIIDVDTPAIVFRNSEFKVDVSLFGYDKPVKRIAIYYRERGGVSYHMNELTTDGSDITDFSFTLFVSPEAQIIEYYIEVYDIDDLKTTYPTYRPTLNPKLLQVTSKRVEKDFVMLTDLTDVKIGDNVLLSVSLFNISHLLKSESIKIFLNDKNVTKDAIITNSLIVYNIENLKKDSQFKIRATKTNGEEINSRIWNIDATSDFWKLTLPFNLSGNVNYKANVNSFSDVKTNEAKHDIHSSRINLHGYSNDIEMNSSFYLSSLNKKNKQAVNRYNIDLSYLRHYYLYMGDKMPYFSDFSLNNQNICGLGSKIKYRFFTFEGYFGENKKEIDLDNSSQNLGKDSFARDITALKLSLGHKNYLKWSLNFTKTKDDVSSLDKNDYFVVSADTTGGEEQTLLTKPKDNVVLSTDFSYTSLSKDFSFGTELAMSSYNANTYNGASSHSEYEDNFGIDLPFDPEFWDNIIVVNDNSIPIKLSKENLAYKIFTNTNIWNNYISASYSLVGSAFYSLSSLNRAKDYYEVSVRDNINFGNTVELTLQYNRYKDNLSRSYSNTNEYDNYGFNMLVSSVNSPTFRLSGNYNTNYVYINDKIIYDLYYDSFERPRNNQKQVSYNYGSGLGFKFRFITSFPFRLDFDYDGYNSEDVKLNTYKFDDDVYRVKFTGNSNIIPLKLELQFKYTNSFEHDRQYTYSMIDGYQESNKGYHKFDKYVYHGRITYRFLNDKFIPYFDIKYVDNIEKDNSEYDSNFNVKSLGVSYKPFTLTTISTSLSNKRVEFADIDKKNNYSYYNFYLNISQSF